jgi:hypothetical protein
VCALAGVLVYYTPDATDRVRQILSSKIKGFEELIGEAEKMEFVPAALASIGLSRIGPSRVVFARSRLKRIRAKAADCEERGPAVKQLIDYLWRVSRPDQNHR